MSRTVGQLRWCVDCRHHRFFLGNLNIIETKQKQKQISKRMISMKIHSIDLRWRFRSSWNCRRCRRPAGRVQCSVDRCETTLWLTGVAQVAKELECPVRISIYFRCYSLPSFRHYQANGSGSLPKQLQHFQKKKKKKKKNHSWFMTYFIY